MKLALTDFQEEAVGETLDSLSEAVERFSTKGKATAVSLTAVTGAGKTVMATAVLEAMFHGSDQVEPDPNLSVLWLTDDPSLNEQTRRKMLVASDLIQPGQLVTIDEGFDQETLDSSTIYFLNIQKLGKGATKYVKTGDSRRHSLWDTIRATIQKRGASFLLVIDEAHRGTSRGTNGERKTIASQLITGDAANGDPPSPIVLGISATPDRFHQAVTGSGRLLHPVEVDVEEVRKSGLIKDLVSISFPSEDQPGDFTLVEQALADTREFEKQWAAFTEKQNLAPVHPVLVIQVRAGVTERELGALLDTIFDVWDRLDERAIGHAFQDHSRLDLGGHTVRYIAPQDIQDDPHLRVVIFKEALTTGWDCPRAEVMVSLRKATDHTYIAQLIGRMVRTPLARRVSTSELLSTVSLYLPHFDEDSVKTVIAGLRKGDDQIASEVTTDAVVCKRNPKVPVSVWDIAQGLPTYTRPAKVHRNDVSRLNALTQLLASTGIDREAPKTARRHVIATMEREANRLGETLSTEAEQLAKLNYETRTVTTLETGRDASVDEKVRDLSTRNVEDLYRQARRRFGDAAAQWYWNALCDAQEQKGKEADPLAAKLEVAALSHDQPAVDAVHQAAAELVDSLRADHSAEIAKLGESDRDRIYAIFQQSRDPQQVGLILPDDINATAPKGTPRHDKHLYANGAGKYPAQLNAWERAVLEARLPEAIAWYRNPSAGSRALGVPYSVAGQAKTMYPDFVFFRETNDGIVADIIDPHDPSRSDTAPKWTGLAEYAAKHKHQLGQILAVIETEDGEMWSVDLRDSNLAGSLEKATGEADIRELFKDHGGKL